MRGHRLKYFTLLLVILPLLADACGNRKSFPYTIKSLVDEPFATDQCYPFEVRFPTKYKGDIVSMGFVKFYPATIKSRTFSNEDASFETELKISKTNKENESLIKMCLSADVVDTTVVELIYEPFYEEGYTGPIAMCGPTVHTIYGFKEAGFK